MGRALTARVNQSPVVGSKRDGVAWGKRRSRVKNRDAFEYTLHACGAQAGTDSVFGILVPIVVYGRLLVSERICLGVHLGLVSASFQNLRGGGGGVALTGNTNPRKFTGQKIMDFNRKSRRAKSTPPHFSGHGKCSYAAMQLLLPASGALCRHIPRRFADGAEVSPHGRWRRNPKTMSHPGTPPMADGRDSRLWSLVDHSGRGR